MITHKTAPATMIAVLILRALVGASSRFNQPIQSESLGSEPDWRCASRNVALMELFTGSGSVDSCQGTPEHRKFRNLNLRWQAKHERNHFSRRRSRRRRVHCTRLGRVY